MRSGKQRFLLLALLSFAVSATFAQTSAVGGQCPVTSVPAPLRSEGLSERLGDILISCSGSTPGAVIAGNLTVALPVGVTNRVDSANLTTDAVVAADLGSGFVPLPVTAQIIGNQIVFSGVNLTVPVTGSYSMRVSGIRAAASSFGISGAPIRVQLVFSGSALPLSQVQVIVGTSQQSFFATLYNRGSITCVGSPLPSTIDLPNLFSAGTYFVSNRVSEGFATAFAVKGAGETNGTRFVLQFSGFPSGVRVFVPDYIGGSSAAQATSGGDLGVPQAVGAYVAGSGSLLLGRVTSADALGANGAAYPPTGVGTIPLTSVSEVSLPGGTGTAVFEVLDANPNLRESAQIPVFVAASEGTGPATAQESIHIGPVSTVATASTNAPIPRFVNLPAGDDCTIVGDCNASYYPKLSVEFQPIRFTALAGGHTNELWGSIFVDNTGGGIMPWTATLQYTDGSGWAFLDYNSGVNNATIRVTADASKLAAGTYRATVLIDAGSKAGSSSVPITLTVSPAPTAPSTPGTGTGTGTGSGTTTPPAIGGVIVSKIVNAATFDPTPLVPGSVGTLMGSNLGGKSVTVTLDGLDAKVLYGSATQVNFVVPAGLRGKNSADLTIAVDGAKSAPQTVILSASWPAIFAHGVLNQDYGANATDAPAAAGSVLQIFATGVGEGATVSAQIGDRKGLVPLYAGPAPDVPGVQQVNVAVPDGVAGSVPLTVCAMAGTQPFCSTAYTVVVK
jgi:uncharacterized protein (TIGR03437 family)